MTKFGVDAATYMKTCAQCGESKLADDCFHINRQSADGFMSKCSDCVNKRGRELYAKRAKGEIPRRAVETKGCAGCGRNLAVHNFYTSPGRPDGLHSYCTTCCAIWREGRAA